MSDCEICGTPCGRKYCKRCARRIEALVSRHYYYVKNYPQARGMARNQLKEELTLPKNKHSVSMAATLEDKILRWFAYDHRNTGLSSCAMMFSLIGKTDIFGRHHPLDPDDLARCLNALKSLGDERPPMAALSRLSPHWAALVKRWPEIEAQFKADCDREVTQIPNASKTYDLMQEIYAPIKAEQQKHYFLNNENTTHLL
jgi:hypothetical protein